MTAIGNETAVSFTLEYDAAMMSDPRVHLGEDRSEDSVLTVNTQESGRIAILVDSGTALMIGQGTTRLVVVTFVVNGKTGGAGEISFGDSIAERSVSDANGNSLAAKWIGIR